MFCERLLLQKALFSYLYATKTPGTMKWLLFILLFTLPQAASAQLGGIREKIETLLAGKQLKAGIALYDFTTGDTLTINAEAWYPMQSVFKFPIALAVLDRVDKGRWRLSDSLYIHKKELPQGTWSPIRERYPEGGIYLSLADLLRYTVSHSDNNGCDILLRLLGGPARVESYLRTAGIDHIDIAKTEADMHRDPQAQYANRTTPRAMIELLRLFNDERLLHPGTQAFLWETMAATSTGSTRTKLPADAVVAHKTGSSDRDAAGITAATNDAGILVLPDGRRIAYALFITDSAEPDNINRGIIADIVHLLYTMNTVSHE